MSKRLAVGPAMKAIREARGFPGAYVATECLISTSHLLNIEADRRRPNFALLERIAEVLGVGVNAISVDLDSCAQHARALDTPMEEAA